MNIVNIIVKSDIVEAGLCTIVEGSSILAPATAAGNLLEVSSQNTMIQTAGKILQSVTAACLALWATWHLVAAFVKMNFEQMKVVNLTGLGFAAMTLAAPLVFPVAKHFAPENREAIEASQKSYSASIKIINIATAAIAMGWFASVGMGLSLPAVLSGVSLISSTCTLESSIKS